MKVSLVPCSLLTLRKPVIRAETTERAFLLDEQIIRVLLCIFTQRNRKQGKEKEILSIFVLVYNLIRFHAEISACEPFFFFVTV